MLKNNLFLTNIYDDFEKYKCEGLILMAFPERAAAHLTYSFISPSLPDKSQKELERIEYGLASFFITLPKLGGLIALAIVVNQFIDNFLLYYAVTQVSYSVVRSYAWGLHLKTDLSCFVSGLILLFGIVFIGVFHQFPYPLMLIIWGINCGLLYRYAPADTEARPLRSDRLRKKLRKKLLVVLVLLMVLTFLNRNNAFSTLITLGVLGESLFTAPFMYKLFKLKGGTSQ
ncbi:accessory gene regulator B family protein [Natronincola peptidivorans]|nr:accessory gene regulator B family protein [Natronincola peptidivorans]